MHPFTDTSGTSLLSADTAVRSVFFRDIKETSPKLSYFTQFSVSQFSPWICSSFAQLLPVFPTFCRGNAQNDYKNIIILHLPEFATILPKF